MSRKLTATGIVLAATGFVTIGLGVWYRDTQAEFCLANTARYGDGLGTCEPGQGLGIFMVGGLLVLVAAIVAAVGYGRSPSDAH